VLLPKLRIFVSRLPRYHHPPRDKCLRREAIEVLAPCDSLLQEAVVRSVSEHTCRYDEFHLVAMRMATRRQMSPGQGEPIGEGRRSVEAAVPVAVAVTDEDLGSVSVQRVGVGGHGRGSFRAVPTDDDSRYDAAMDLAKQRARRVEVADEVGYPPLTRSQLARIARPVICPLTSAIRCSPRPSRCSNGGPRRVRRDGIPPVGVT